MLITFIINGLMTASILLILSLGMAIIFGIMDVVNLAHGELIVVGAYVTYTVLEHTELPYVVAALCAFVVTALIGVLIERIFIKKIYGKTAETLLVTYALSIAFQQIIRLIYGSGYIHVSSPINGSFKFDSIIMPKYYVCIIIIAIIVFVSTLLIFNKTKIGIQVRAVSQNRQMSGCLGVNTKKIDTLTFAYGTGLAGLAGSIIAPINSISPFVGGNYIVNSFMSVVLGGVSSLYGTVVGATLIGESNGIIAGYVDTVFAEMIVIFAVIVIIRFKPKGLITKERR